MATRVREESSTVIDAGTTIWTSGILFSNNHDRWFPTLWVFLWFCLHAAKLMHKRSSWYHVCVSNNIILTKSWKTLSLRIVCVVADKRQGLSSHNISSGSCLNRPPSCGMRGGGNNYIKSYFNSYRATSANKQRPTHTLYMHALTSFPIHWNMQSLNDLGHFGWGRQLSGGSVRYCSLELGWGVGVEVASLLLMVKQRCVHV